MATTRPVPSILIGLAILAGTAPAGVQAKTGNLPWMVVKVFLNSEKWEEVDEAETETKAKVKRDQIANADKNLDGQYFYDVWKRPRLDTTGPSVVEFPARPDTFAAPRVSGARDVPKPGKPIASPGSSPAGQRFNIELPLNTGQDENAGPRGIPETIELINREIDKLADPKRPSPRQSADGRDNARQEVERGKPLLQVMDEHDKKLKDSIVGQNLLSRSPPSTSATDHPKDLLDLLRTSFSEKLKDDEKRRQQDERQRFQREQRRDALKLRREEEDLRVRRANDTINANRQRSQSHTTPRYRPNVLP